MLVTRHWSKTPQPQLRPGFGLIVTTLHRMGTTAPVEYSIGREGTIGCISRGRRYSGRVMGR